MGEGGFTDAPPLALCEMRFWDVAGRGRIAALEEGLAKPLLEQRMLKDLRGLGVRGT